MIRTYMEIFGEKPIIISEKADKNSPLIAKRQSSEIVLLVEPFTWAWVAITLAEGAIAYIGGQAIASILGNNVDVKVLIENAVKELKQFIKEALLQDDIDKCQARINSLTRDLLAYENSPNTSKHRLDNADIESSLLMSTLSSKGKAGIAPYAQAVSLRLLALQVRAKALKEKKELKNLISTVDEAVSHVSNETSKIFIKQVFQITHVEEVTLEKEPDEGGESGIKYGNYYACFNDHDGNFRCSISDNPQYALNEAEKERESYINSLVKEFHTTRDNFIAPLREIMSIWERAKDSANEQLSE